MTFDEIQINHWYRIKYDSNVVNGSYNGIGQVISKNPPCYDENVLEVKCEDGEDGFFGPEDFVEEVPDPSGIKIELKFENLNDFIITYRAIRSNCPHYIIDQVNDQFGSKEPLSHNDEGDSDEGLVIECDENTRQYIRQAIWIFFYRNVPDTGTSFFPMPNHKFSLAVERFLRRMGIQVSQNLPD